MFVILCIAIAIIAIVFRYEFGYFVGRYIVGPVMWEFYQLKALWDTATEMTDKNGMSSREASSRLKYEEYWQQKAFETGAKYYRDFAERRRKRKHKK